MCCLALGLVCHRPSLIAQNSLQQSIVSTKEGLRSQQSLNDGEKQKPQAREEAGREDNGYSEGPGRPAPERQLDAVSCRAMRPQQVR